MSLLLSVISRYLFLVEVRFIDFDSLNMEILVLFVEETVRHNRVACYLISFYCLAHFNIFSLILQKLSRENWLSDDGSLSNRILALKVNDIIMLSRGSQSSFIYLLVLRLITSRVRVNIVRLHVLAIDGATNCRVCVTVTIRMKSRLPEIGGNGRVREPLADPLHLIYLFFYVLELLGCLRSLFLQCSLSLLAFEVFLRLLLPLLFFLLGGLPAPAHCSFREQLVAHCFKDLLFFSLHGLEVLSH